MSKQYHKKILIYQRYDFIVKVQRSVASSDHQNRMLVYNKNKDIFYEAIMTPEVKALLQGRLKAYFKARLVNSQIQIKEEVEPQNW